MMFHFLKPKITKPVTKSPRTRKWIFLGHEELAKIRNLRQGGKLDEAENILKHGEPTPAVLDELRKISSVRAKQAKKEGNWKAVIEYLNGYTEYANQWKQYCIKMVNQAPPPHNKSDKTLLLEAKRNL